MVSASKGVVSATALFFGPVRKPLPTCSCSDRSKNQTAPARTATAARFSSTLLNVFCSTGDRHTAFRAKIRVGESLVPSGSAGLTRQRAFRSTCSPILKNQVAPVLQPTGARSSSAFFNTFRRARGLLTASRTLPEVRSLDSRVGFSHTRCIAPHPAPPPCTTTLGLGFSLSSAQPPAVSPVKNEVHTERFGNLCPELSPARLVLYSTLSCCQPRPVHNPALSSLPRRSCIPRFLKNRTCVYFFRTSALFFFEKPTSWDLSGFSSSGWRPPSGQRKHFVFVALPIYVFPRALITLPTNSISLKVIITLGVDCRPGPVRLSRRPYLSIHTAVWTQPKQYLLVWVLSSYLALLRLNL